LKATAWFFIWLWCLRYGVEAEAALISLVSNLPTTFGVFDFAGASSQHNGTGPLSVKVSADQRYKLYVNGKLVGDASTTRRLATLVPAETYHPPTTEGVSRSRWWSFGRYAPIGPSIIPTGLRPSSTDTGF